MNKLRQHWKDNGTPFFFHFEFGGIFFHLDNATCKKLDYVSLSGSDFTALDVLVDCQYLDRTLQRISDEVLIKSVKSLIYQTVLNIINNNVSFSTKD